jgi:hypothetical protein
MNDEPYSVAIVTNILERLINRAIGIYEGIPLIGATTRLIPPKFRKKMGGNIVSGCMLSTMPQLGDLDGRGLIGFGNCARTCFTARGKESSNVIQEATVYGIDSGNDKYTCSTFDCRHFNPQDLPEVTQRMLHSNR